MIKDGSVYCKGEITEMSWNALIQSAFLSRVNLSAKGHYVRPHIYFDKSTETGRPFAYHVYGVGMTEVTLDCLRGTYAINSVSIMHDCGTSFNPLIDIGQIEGALLQGIGWMSMEEIKYDKSGHLMSDSLSTYKIPDISFAPGKVSISFLQTDGNEQAVLKAKAVGEPPFMYGMGTYFALRNAMLAFRPNLQFTYNAPLTPEKILLAIYEP
jgi:xanthine dehydrogenase large subunit